MRRSTLFLSPRASEATGVGPIGGAAEQGDDKVRAGKRTGPLHPQCWADIEEVDVSGRWLG